MKKSVIIICAVLLILWLSVFCVAVIKAVSADIVGGADWPTLHFMLTECLRSPFGLAIRLIRNRSHLKNGEFSPFFCVFRRFLGFSKTGFRMFFIDATPHWCCLNLIWTGESHFREVRFVSLQTEKSGL